MPRRVLADLEECGLEAIVGERLEHGRRVLRPGAVVEGQHNFLIAQKIVLLEMLEAEARSAGRVDLDDARQAHSARLVAQGDIVGRAGRRRSRSPPLASGRRYSGQRARARQERVPGTPARRKGIQWMPGLPRRRRGPGIQAPVRLREHSCPDPKMQWVQQRRAKPGGCHPVTQATQLPQVLRSPTRRSRPQPSSSHPPPAHELRSETVVVNIWFPNAYTIRRKVGFFLNLVML